MCNSYHKKTGLPEKIRLCLGNGCFIAGTLVTTRSGLKPIEEIVIGDYVLSRNQETGETSYKKVTDTLVRSTQEICTIELETGNIKLTTGHLFMVKNKWWKAAVKLVTGDILVTSYGEDQIVKSIKVEEKGYPVTTYNLTVEDNHTFFVSSEKVLTHNKGKFNKCELVGEVAENATKGATDVVEKVKYGEHYTKVNGKKALKPNVEYVTEEGYKYVTDSSGRISNVEGSLDAGKAKRNAYAQRMVGKDNGRLATDDGGHLIASIFKGSGDLDNLVPMDATLNRGDWKVMENSWAKALDKGKTVDIKIKSIYSGTSQRPISFKVKYRVDNGRWIKETFTN